MDDLSSLLLAAIEETERLAREATEGPWRAGVRGGPTVEAEGWTVASGVTDLDAAHIAHNDPSSVLRRCSADRRIVETTRMAQGHYREVLAETEGDPGSSARVSDAWRQATTWEKAMALVAEGYGLTDHQEGQARG